MQIHEKVVWGALAPPIPYTLLNIKFVLFFNFQALYKELGDTDWELILVGSTVDQIVSEFYSFLSSIISKFAPVYGKPRTKKPWPKWYTPEIKNVLRQLKTFRRRGRNSNSDYYSNKISFNRLLLVELIGSARRQFMATVENSFFSDPRSFYKFFKEDGKGKIIFDSMTLDGSLIKDANFASHFASFFSSIFDSNLNSPFHPDKIDPPYDWVNSCLFIHEISEHEILDAIGRLADVKSPGPDKVPSYLVKGLKDLLVKPLLKIFNLSLAIIHSLRNGNLLKFVLSIKTMAMKRKSQITGLLPSLQPFRMSLNP